MNMPRFVSFFGVVAGLVFGAFVISFLFRLSAPPPNAVPEIFPALSVADNSVVETATTTPTTPSKEDIVPLEELPPQNKTAAPAPSPTPVPVPAPAPIVAAPSEPALGMSSSGDISFDAAASLLRNALVNIICSAPAGGAIKSISGSGVFIDAKGVILTNAHIAQYFLLADRGVSCVIRSGSPAANRYKANLIYISPQWLRANANVLTETLPKGTGERDFAFLAVRESATSAPLPSSFPAIALAAEPSFTGTPVVIASYGAQFLASSQVQSALFPTIVFGSVKEVYTFGTNTIDVLALGGSAAAQEGSSGGGVADSSGTLVGTITTSTVTGATDTRSLDAITASYIRAEYASDTGRALDILLAQSPVTSISTFAPQIPSLEAIITASLP